MRSFRQPSQTFKSGEPRSDSVRTRRTARSRDRAKAASGRITNPGASRPVTFRGASIGASRYNPVYRQAGGARPRRVFTLSLDSASGAELRLPAIPLVNPGWRLFSGLLVIGMIVALFSFQGSEMFRITSVDIRGLERISSEEVTQKLNLENRSIIEVEPARLQDDIAKTFPELADVNIAVELPNFVTLSARERQPIMAWVKGEDVLWVDAEGVVFPARGTVEGTIVTVQTDYDIPLIPLPKEESTADEESTKKDSQKVKQGGEASYAGRRADLRLLTASLLLAKKLPEGTQIIYDHSNGLGWNDPDGWKVFVGKELSDFDAKFAIYQAILKNLRDQGVQLELISVEHPNAPFYRAVEPVDTPEE